MIYRYTDNIVTPEMMQFFDHFASQFAIVSVACLSYTPCLAVYLLHISHIHPGLGSVEMTHSARVSTVLVMTAYVMAKGIPQQDTHLPPEHCGKCHKPVFCSMGVTASTDYAHKRVSWERGLPEGLPVG